MAKKGFHSMFHLLNIVGLSPEDVKAMSKHGVLAGRHGMLVTKIAHLICSPQGNGTMTIETARANLVFFS